MMISQFSTSYCGVSPRRIQVEAEEMFEFSNISHFCGQPRIDIL